MKNALRHALPVIFVFATHLLPAGGQSITSEILGTVRDASGALISDAHVTVRQLATGTTRESRTDSIGSYDIAGLQPGGYEVVVRHDGFKTVVRSNINLLVNQQAVVDADLPVGSVEQQIVVTEAGPILETTTSQMSTVVSANILRELPLNGRDLFQLTLLQPGVLPTTNAGPSPFSEGGITKAAVQGSRPTMNNFNLDGGDINDPGFNTYPGGPAGVQLGVEAIREFRVLLNTYSAEYGRNAGANIQLVSRSGTNEFHGSVFDFVRNSALDARNYFDLSQIPSFTRNQFGGALGGPLLKNKLFFFADYEGLDEQRGITTSATVPDDNAHLGLLPSAANPSLLINVGVNPLISPFLALFPHANGASLSGGLAVLNTSRNQPTLENYGLLRVDDQLTEKDQLFARWVIDNGYSIVPFQSTFVPGFDGKRTVADNYLLLSWQRVINTSLLNEAKFNYNRTSYQATTDNESPLSISLENHRPLGGLAISGLPLIGNNLIFPSGTSSNTFEEFDNVFLTRGRHSLKFGADAKRIQVNGPFDFFIDGEYSFDDLSSFGIPAQSTDPALEFFLEGVPYTYFGVDPNFADSNRGYRQNYLGFYMQDDWRILPQLTLNLGLRWEYSSNPSEEDNRLSNIRKIATDPGPTVGKIWQSVPLDLWSPRVGFAWTPEASGKTVLRGGFGVMRDQIWANLYFNTRFYEPFYKPLLYILPRFAAPPTSVDSIVGPIPPSVVGSFGMTYRPSFPYYMQYNLNIERQLDPVTILQIAYVGSRGVHLVRTGEANDLPGGRSINPLLGSIPLIVTDANSAYDSLQGRLQRSFSSGLSLQASYTYSKSIDDQSGAYPSDWDSESGVSQNFFDREADRGRSSFDRRHAFVFNSLYDLPFGPGRRWGQSLTGVTGKLAEGFRTGLIVSALSGVPFTANLGSFNNSATFAADPADRPNLKPGVNLCSGAVTYRKPTGWFNPAVFTLPPPGVYGNSGRNTMCGPGLVDVDLSLTKQTKLNDRFSIQFRAESFNLLNHANFDVPVNTQGPTGSGGNGDQVFVGRRQTLADKVTLCTAQNDPENLGCGVLSPNAGIIFRTVTSSRQIQFGMKLIF
ncbi:Oar protein [Acidisarcina polymorpha]|uniref:Oar protein n=1 Tax=Acidisarcina polymorpha TaxID=2211140 RepID=A0A2Z5G829_9BACT|nr:TonB-dependent receptor [Acidisarcina polymorpha]AXC14815.1 Oar protein [Acidisarcina polymorpha]